MILACFDKFIVFGTGNNYDGLGYDSYEQDFWGLSCLDISGEDEAKNPWNRWLDSSHKTKFSKRYIEIK